MTSRLKQAIEADILSGLYDGAATIVAVGGEIAFNETIGYADRANETLLRHDSVFPVFSISKALTAVALLQRIERGEAKLDTPVCEVIPEFGIKGKARATLGQLLCHTAGVAPGFPAVPCGASKAILRRSLLPSAPHLRFRCPEKRRVIRRSWRTQLRRRVCGDWTGAAFAFAIS